MTQSIGERIRILRKGKKLSGEAFARSIGVSKSHISKIENESTGISEPVLNQISSVYSINKTWLLTGEGDPAFPTEMQESQADYSPRRSKNQTELLLEKTREILESDNSTLSRALKENILAFSYALAQGRAIENLTRRMETLEEIIKKNVPPSGGTSTDTRKKEAV